MFGHCVPQVGRPADPNQAAPSFTDLLRQDRRKGSHISTRTNNASRRTQRRPEIDPRRHRVSFQASRHARARLNLVQAMTPLLDVSRRDETSCVRSRRKLHVPGIGTVTRRLQRSL